MIKYTITLFIDGEMMERSVVETRTLKDVYNDGKSWCRNAKRNHCKLRVVISDAQSGEVLVRLYTTPTTHGWIARHSGLCKYSGVKKNGYRF